VNDPARSEYSEQKRKNPAYRLSSQILKNMNEKNKLVKVYTGTEMTVHLLKGLLEEIGVKSTIQNNYKSGIEVGFVGGVQSAVDLFIQQSDFETAEPMIRDFIAKNRG
jgi:hypothetical protein